MPADGGMPMLPDFGVFLYVRDNAPELALQLAEFVRDKYELMAPPSLKNKTTWMPARQNMSYKNKTLY